jgi:ankyrin repeat protein
VEQHAALITCTTRQQYAGPQRKGEARRRRHILVASARKSGSEETAALLLARGVAGSAVDLEGVTAHHLATRDDSKEFINLLINNGAEDTAKRQSWIHTVTLLYGARL